MTSGYGGTFLVDPQTFDLVRLMVRSDQLPSEVDACQATTTLDYDRVRLNDSSFLLPSQVQLDIVTRSGIESRNRTVYSGCHEFLGKSTLSFGDTPLGPDAAAPGFPGSSPASPERTPAIPLGLSFKVEFTQAIDAATAAAGDKISGKIRSAIRDSTSNQILVPEGSPVTARIVRLEHIAAPPQSLTIAVKLETVTVG